MAAPHLIVDGSNIATEGRSLPSLQQLLDAVAAVEKEGGYGEVTCIVDATFGHRIDESERAQYDELVSSGTIITPPAGVIGRGDAFILEVADRADAVVLSNDSFQEFHGTYRWLFDEGRLLGGKHVPGVGWIFLARNPVRGPTSRRAISEAKRKRRGTKPDTSKKQSSKSSSSRKTAKKKSTARKQAETGRKRGGKEPEPYNEPLPFIEFVGAHPVGSTVQAEVEQFASHGAYVVVDGTRCYVSLKSISDPPPRSARDVFELGDVREFVVVAIDTPRRGIDLAVPGMPAADEAVADDDGTDDSRSADARPAEDEAPAPKRSSSTSSRRGGRGADAADAPESPPRGDRSAAPAAEAAPKAADDGDEKLSVSERRRRRAAAEAAAKEAEEQAASKKSAKKRAPAKKRTTKKTAAKKSTAKKAASKKTASKKTTAKKSTTKKTTAKKTTAKKSTKKAAAKKSTAKKATSKKTATKKRAAKKATTKKSAAKKAAAKKSTAKTTPSKKTPAKRKAAAKRSPAKKSSSTRAATSADDADS